MRARLQQFITRHHPHIIAGLAYLVLALWQTWPQPLLIGRALVGGPIAQADGWQAVWYLWWFRTALLEGYNPLWVHLLYWPEGVPTALIPHAMTSIPLILPVLLLAGPLAAYGVVAIFHLLLCGLTTYLLALRVTGSWPAALAAGLLLVAAPGHMVRFADGQLEHVILEWLPLVLLALLFAREHPTRFKSGLWLALTVALVAYTSWYHALFLAVLTATWIIWHATARRALWPLLRPWLIALPLLLLLLLPVLPGLLTGLDEAARPAEDWRSRALDGSADPVDLLLPNANHPLWGRAVTAYQQPLHPNSAGWIVTPGYAMLLLAAVGLLLRWREARLWGALAGVLLLLSLGPALQINGIQTGLPLPFALLAELPGAGFARRPRLAALVALVPLAVAAAWGMRALWERLDGWPRLLLCGLLLAGWLLETAPPPYLAFRDDTSPVYETLRDEPGALLVVPLDPGALHLKSASLVAQMTHGRPIIGGYVARPPDYPLKRGAPLIGQLESRTCAEPDIIPENHDASTVLSVLAHYDVTQIVLHSQRMSTERLACARDLIHGMTGLTPTLRAGPVLVYDVPPAAPQPFVFLGDGWHYLERDGARTWRWMRAKGELYIVHTGEAHGAFVVTMQMESLQRARSVNLTLNQQAMEPITVTPGHSRVYHLLIPVQPGQNELRMQAPTDRDPDPTAPRAISLAVELVKIEPLR